MERFKFIPSIGNATVIAQRSMIKDNDATGIPKSKGDKKASRLIYCLQKVSKEYKKEEEI
jgi:hypothetical protein